MIASKTGDEAAIAGKRHLVPVNHQPDGPWRHDPPDKRALLWRAIELEAADLGLMHRRSRRFGSGTAHRHEDTDKHQCGA